MSSVDKTTEEGKMQGVGCGDGFAKCTEQTFDAKFNMHHVRCRRGLWAVSSADRVDALREAAHYWRQYYADGEYDSILANDADERRDPNKGQSHER